jgi:glycosyltransferase involved in cell wall biosynthesis
MSEVAENSSLNGQAGNNDGKVRVLALARNYPNPVFPRLGLWTERLVFSTSEFCETKVIAPVPYCPPLPKSFAYSKFRQVPFHESVKGMEIFHPRFVTGPGFSLHSFESAPYYLGVVRLVRQLRARFSFDLIHAHFSYPDGVVAAALGKQFNVPVIITEHAAWQPWLDNYRLVKRQVMWAARRCEFISAVSDSQRKSIVHFTGDSDHIRVIPNLVDGAVFTLKNGIEKSSSTDQILFVGLVRKVKALDVLLRAIRLLLDSGRNVKLVIVGDSFYPAYRKDYSEIVRLVETLGLKNAVQFVGAKSPEEVAKEIQRSALLVLPSRRESFGAVLLEALACGKPVVATRCGGPEQIVNDEVGILVPPEDAEALARGIEHVLERKQSYDPSKLRSYALENFGVQPVGQAIVDLYSEALESFGKKQKQSVEPGQPAKAARRRAVPSPLTVEGEVKRTSAS